VGAAREQARQGQFGTVNINPGWLPPWHRPGGRTWLMMRPPAAAAAPSPPLACAVRRRSVSAFFCRSSSSCFSLLRGQGRVGARAGA
jgi:hypothetical protein